VFASQVLQLEIGDLWLDRSIKRDHNVTTFYIQFSLLLRPKRKSKKCLSFRVYSLELKNKKSLNMKFISCSIALLLFVANINAGKKE
jgi:hypothetical protein